MKTKLRLIVVLDCEYLRTAVQTALTGSGMTRYALAKKSGLTLPCIYNFLRGRTQRINLTTIKKILSVLSIPLLPGPCPICTPH